MINIKYTRKDRQRNPWFKELLMITHHTLGFSHVAVTCIKAHSIDLHFFSVAQQMQHYCDLTEKVISQTE